MKSTPNSPERSKGKSFDDSPDSPNVNASPKVNTPEVNAAPEAEVNSTPQVDETPKVDEAGAKNAAREHAAAVDPAVFNKVWLPLKILRVSLPAVSLPAASCRCIIFFHKERCPPRHKSRVGRLKAKVEPPFTYVTVEC